jgi:hypothetical protein
MQNCLKSLVFLFSLFSFVPGSTMAKKPELKISVQCKDQQCEFHGEDMWFHIAVHNAGAEPISAGSMPFRVELDLSTRRA